MDANHPQIWQKIRELQEQKRSRIDEKRRLRDELNKMYRARTREPLAGMYSIPQRISSLESEILSIETEIEILRRQVDV